jgi:RNAse (barnase) inhibitor barstar
LVALTAEAETLGFPVFIISPEKATSTAEWLQHLAQQLNFPAYFGANFDALYDCLCDREVMPQAACVLMIKHLEALEEEGSDTLIAVLQAVADEWREQQRPFWALFSAPGLDLDPLPQK